MFAFLLYFFTSLAYPPLLLRLLFFQFLTFDSLVYRVAFIFFDDHENSQSEKVQKVGDCLNALLPLTLEFL